MGLKKVKHINNIKTSTTFTTAGKLDYRYELASNTFSSNQLKCNPYDYRAPRWVELNWPQTYVRKIDP